MNSRERVLGLNNARLPFCMLIRPALSPALQSAECASRSTGQTSEANKETQAHTVFTLYTVFMTV